MLLHFELITTKEGAIPGELNHYRYKNYGDGNQTESNQCLTIKSSRLEVCLVCRGGVDVVQHIVVH